MSLLTPGGRSPYYAGQRRGRGRRRAVKALLVLVLVAAVAGGVWYQFFRRDESVPVASDCVTPAPSTAASPTGEPLPAPPTITVSVLNTTDVDGLAKGVADALTSRGFGIGEVMNAPAGTAVPGAAEVRFGPGGQLAAQVVAAQIGDPSAVGQVAAPLPPGTVQVVLGAGFTEVNDPATAQAIIAPTPAPEITASPCVIG